MSSQEIPAHKGDDEILQKLQEQLSLEDGTKLRRGLALLEDEEPTTKRSSALTVRHSHKESP